MKCSGAPDYMLVCWSIDRLKCIGMTSLSLELSNNAIHSQVIQSKIRSFKISLFSSRFRLIQRIHLTSF